jgi:hypothetical protein
MNVQRACVLLDLLPHEIHTPKLKQKYRKKCLLFHPDKCGDKHRFVELKEAYDFLGNLPKEDSFLDAFDEKMLRQYVYTLQQTPLDFLKHPLFVRYFVDPVQHHLQRYKTYLLNPTLEQLLRKDIYYLEEEQLYIPLWHQEIVFHGKIKVLLEPSLPKGIELDDDNNILVTYSEVDDVVLKWISILTDENQKKQIHQTQGKSILLSKKGIPRIHSSIYQVQELSDLILLFS